ncbi:MAG: peptidoglycan-binding protein [Granulosicoccus sp.]|nr:peptidoglycan-binding protein [Granulosicoccus sp.]
MAMNFNRVPSYVRKEIEAPKKVVKSGARGMAVQRIQEWLQYHDFSTAIDADFGPATATRVREFQSVHGLKTTGTVNRDTWRLLVEPMLSSLKEPTINHDDTAVSTVSLVAAQHLAQTPIEIGGPNRGPWVRLYCGGNDGDEWAWCAGFVTLIVQQAYFYRSEKVPFSGSVSCDTIAAQARSAGLFVSGKSIYKGDVSWDDFGGMSIFLLRRTDTDWVHTGFATGANKSSGNLVFETVEGNTNNNGSREGIKATSRIRSLSGSNYDFISLAGT